MNCHHADRKNLILLVTTWLVMTALLVPIGDFPLNDDWVYALSVKSILEKGQFQLPDGSQATVFAQAYWGALFCSVFGFSFSVLRASTLVLGLGGILATYGLMREQQARPKMALLAAITVAVNPLYFNLANSFMTDVPFYCFAVTSLFLMARGFRRSESIWLVLGVVLSWLALLTRQFGFVLPLGFAAAYCWNRPRNWRILAAALVPLTIGLILHLLLQHWLTVGGRATLEEFSILHRLSVGMTHDLGRIVRRSVGLVYYLGFFLLPSSLIFFHAHLSMAHPSEKVRILKSALISALFLGMLCAIVVMRLGHIMPFGSNILTSFGFGPLPLRDTYMFETNLPKLSNAWYAIWLAITALTVMGATLLLERFRGACMASLRRNKASGQNAINRLTVLLLVSLGAYLLLVVIVTPSFFDRYMLLCFPLVLSLLYSRLSKLSDFRGIRCKLTDVVFSCLRGSRNPPSVWSIARAMGLPSRQKLVALRPNFPTPVCTNAELVRIQKVLGVAMAWARDNWAQKFAWVMLAFSAAFSVGAMHDYLAWNTKRWAALRELTDVQGIKPDAIDGGYEFNGWFLYKSGGPSYGTGKSWWWVKDDEYVIAMGPIPGYKQLASYPFRPWLMPADSRVVVLQRQRP